MSEPGSRSDIGRGWPGLATVTVFAVALAGLLALPAAGFGQVAEGGLRGWVDLGVGGGQVSLSGSPGDAAFALDFGGGVWLSQRLGLGFRLGGWTIEEYDLWDPEQGESISEIFAVLAYRPLLDLPLSLAAESGLASHTVNDPGQVSREGAGLGWRVAGSWRFKISKRLGLSPSLVLSWGRIDPNGPGMGRIEYSGTAILLRLGWAW